MITCTDTRLRAILVIVAGETFYLDCRRGYRKQAGAIFLGVLVLAMDEIYVRRRCLLIPEREGFIPVFPDPSKISLLWGCDGARDCTFTKAISSARPALVDEESVAVEGHERGTAPRVMSVGKYRE